MNKPILYSFRRCPYAMRARMALFLANIECEYREVILNNKPKQMLEISPKGTVPVMALENKVIDESLEIIDWVLDSNSIFKDILDGNEIKVSSILINKFDNEFKYNLDRYKYAQRYEDKNPLFHRENCMHILRDLDLAIKGDWFYGNHIQKIDICILPFIRQFRIADTNWFDSLDEIKNVKKYLNFFLESTLLSSVMYKYKPWKEGDRALSFPITQ